MYPTGDEVNEASLNTTAESLDDVNAGNQIKSKYFSYKLSLARNKYYH